MVDSEARTASSIPRYAGALAISATAVAIRWFLRAELGPQFPFFLVFLAVLACARFFGLGPSLAALAAGAIGSVFVVGEHQPLPIALFLISSSFAIWIIEALRRANARAEQQAALAAQRLQDLARESAQRQNEERHAAQLRAIVESSEDAILSNDLAGVIQSWNYGAEKIFGYTAAEAIGRPVSILIPPDQMHEENDVMARIRRGDAVKPFETVRRHKSGREISLSMTVSPIHDSYGRVVGCSNISRDISEQRKLQEQLRETQRLESLGVLAGGLAHDFNNLLTGIMGNASLIVDEEPAQPARRRRANEILNASERAALLIRQMLAYAGKARTMLERIDLSALIREFEPLLRSSLPRLVRLELQLDPGLPMIEADHSQMQQLVMNLAINGAEAMEGLPGTVVVSTRTQVTDSERQVVLEVSDTGCGMDEAVLSRIFDPFYTTKFTGRGLGLAAVMGIIRAHRGSIAIESTSGKGSKFTVTIPAINDDRNKATDGTADTEGSGTILVVDDEEMVRNMARHTLERCGYRVEVAADGQTAVQTFSEQPSGFAAVLLDLTMPVMDGEEALRRIQNIRPDVTVVLSSGYSEAEAVRKFHDRGLCEYLQKPYTAATLVRKIKIALRRNGQ